MCGIGGFVSQNMRREDREGVSAGMRKALRHRGPDADGTWSDGSMATLVHTRLSILDLSPMGAQPMHSSDDRFVLTFNGEIYNYLEIRAGLEREGARFRGSSDTEVLVELISRSGVRRALQQLRGMFAFAVWDKQERRLTLARDRLGEKPLYYGMLGRDFVFGSELKAIFCHPEFKFEIEPDALSYFFKYNYIPAPMSVFKGIRKLRPGHFFEWEPGLHPTLSDSIDYWNFPQPLVIDEVDETEALDRIETCLKEVVRGQIRSDVPLGCFLSGGIDSSLISALVQKSIDRPLNTFSIGFREKDYDESHFAREVARHLGCEHHEWIVSPQDIQSVIPQVAQIYDEPFADSSQLPTVLLSRFTKRHVTVSLSGDGGDELFGGYNRYFWAESIWRKMRMVPRPLRHLLSLGGSTVSPATMDVLYKLFSFVLPQLSNPSHKVLKVLGILNARSATEVYDRLLALWVKPPQILLGGRDCKLIANIDDAHFVAEMMWKDAKTYLPGDIMVKVDRASMSVSLETRAPFLDHKLFELVWSLPQDLKTKDGRGKFLLRKLLAKHLPAHLIDRPKMGFAVPLEHWMRGDLKEWMCDVLNGDRISRDGILNAETVSRHVREHVSGSRNWQYHLWTVLVFQTWYEQWKK